MVHPSEALDAARGARAPGEIAGGILWIKHPQVWRESAPDPAHSPGARAETAAGDVLVGRMPAPPPSSDPDTARSLPVHRTGSPCVAPAVAESFANAPRRYRLREDQRCIRATSSCLRRSVRSAPRSRPMRPRRIRRRALADRRTPCRCRIPPSERQRLLKTGSLSISATWFLECSDPLAARVLDAVRARTL